MPARLQSLAPPQGRVGNTGAFQPQPSVGRTAAGRRRTRASCETFPAAPALIPAAASPVLAPPGPLFPRALAAARRGQARSPPQGLGVPRPPSPIPFSGAQCPGQSPPSGTLFPPSFLPSSLPFPPSISLPSTGNSEAAPKLAGRRPALRPCARGDQTRHLRPPLGAHSPAGALPPPPPPGTRSLRAPGDGSDLSSSCLSGRRLRLARGRRGGQPDGRGGDGPGLLPLALGPPSGPGTLTVLGFSRRTPVVSGPPKRRDREL